MAERSIVDELSDLASRMERSFREERRVLSFAEYLELFAAHPVRYARDASRYLRDLFDHFGKVLVERPTGKHTRFTLFDLPWLGEDDRRREALHGQEAVQEQVYRVLSNFVREGRPNRLILLHGPTGSAKSTVAACMIRALEHYSSKEEGALYRFHWVFPNQRLVKGAIGFSERKGGGAAVESYAHLPEEQIDARLFVEVRDHPLFLIPQDERRGLVEKIFERAGADESPPEWLLRGRLSHKSRQIFDALMLSTEGSLAEVLCHVQVERYFISKRYRTGAVTIGPELSVDAGERQITADRSLSALPTALQAATLYEAHGELVDGCGGLIEFSDMLKRPLDAFKYLQLTAETGEIALRSQTISLNAVMIASANEEQLEAFRGHPEYVSFRGRLEPICCPYLRSWRAEKAIYDAQIAPQVHTHVAPHATSVAAMFAVLTRLLPPQASEYEKPLSALVEDLSAVEKMDLYADGKAPERLDEESAKALRANVGVLYEEWASAPVYEGHVGASAREMRRVLLDAAQDPRFACLSPFSVLDQLDALCDQAGDYDWLALERRPGGYHDHSQFREHLRHRLLDAIEDEFRVASGLVDEQQYVHVFERYVKHVSYWSKGEKLQSEVTGKFEDPDERLMDEVETRLGGPERGEPFRHALMNRIAAWAIDNPDRRVDNATVFASELRRLREAVFRDRRAAIANLCRSVVVMLREEGRGLDAAQQEAAKDVVRQMKARFGYEDSSAGDAAVAVVKERFAELLP